MVMRFRRDWDFDPGNKQLDLNSLTQDREVIAALQEALGLAQGGTAAEVSFDPAGTELVATDVQAALVEVLGRVPEDTAPVEEVVLLEAGQGAADVPAGTPVGALIVTKV